MEKFDIKKIGVKNLVLLLIAGILLLVCTLPDLFRSSSEESKKDKNFYSENNSNTMKTLTDEERLDAILSQVEGVGRVKSMIFTQKQEGSTIEGIVIVADGVGTGKTAAYILDAAEALFGIPKHKIIILPMKRENGSD